MAFVLCITPLVVYSLVHMADGGSKSCLHSLLDKAVISIFVFMVHPSPLRNVLQMVENNACTFQSKGRNNHLTNKRSTNVNSQSNTNDLVLSTYTHENQIHEILRLRV